MTNLEAIKILDNLKPGDYSNPYEKGEAIVMAISALQAQEAKRSTESSSTHKALDTISRQAAIDAICDNCDTVEASCPHYPCGRYVAVEKLPSAQPNRNTGWWLIREGISDAQCSECGMYFNDVYDMDNSDAFCRHCGAKMEGLKVVEDE